MSGGQIGASDWSLDPSWDSGTKPASADNAIIPGAFDGNVTMSLDEGGVDLDLLYVHHLFKGKFGTSANPIAIAAKTLKVFGSAGFYMEADDNGSVSLNVDFARIECRDNRVPVELGTEGGAASGEWDRISILRGKLTLKSSILFPAAGALEIGYVSDRDSDAQVEIEAGADTLAKLRMNGGRLKSNSAITEAHIAGGRYIQDTVAPNTVYVDSGGILQIDDEVVTGDGSVIVVYDGGTLDLLQNAAPKVINTLWIWPKARVLWDYDGGEIQGQGLHSATNLVDMRDGPNR